MSAGLRNPMISLCAAMVVASIAGGAGAAPAFPPSPYDILASQDLEPPVVDAVPFCVPEGLDPALDPLLEQASTGEWQEARDGLADWRRGLDAPDDALALLDAVLHARAGVEREDWLASEERLRALLREDALRDRSVCPRLELARLLMLMGRESEAAAQLVRAEGWIEERGGGTHAAEIDFWQAELLYRTDRPFDAHLAFRKIANGDRPRLALAARLRLTDLSFDSGKIDQVSDEYEALLPRASAFGASTTGWALRASEAALDAGDPTRAIAWLERFLESGPERDARDAAEIRLADLDLVYDDVLGARKRLAGVTGRRRGDRIGALAAVRAIALDVSASSPEQRLDLLLGTIRDHRAGVRRYALGVLMDELAERGDFDGALAVATRLAYEGIDPVVTPDFGPRVDAMLARIASEEQVQGDCGELVRGLGGRYGILIERASQPAPFARLGECFETLELPWLAVTVYRAITRRFGTAGATIVALPLARSSLAVGEIALARRMAQAALDEPEEGDPEVDAWRAVLARADFMDARWDAAARGLRRVVDAPSLRRARGAHLQMLAQTLGQRSGLEDAALIARRAGPWLDAGDLSPADQASMIEAAMLAAHAYRRAGRSADASPLYRVVDRHAEPGALRSSARFWLGLAGRDGADGEPAWGEDPNVALGSPWGRVALFERRLEPLWRAYRGAIR